MNRIRAYLRSLREELRQEFEAALDGEYTSHQVAGSFALGVFIVSLPTLGTGLLAFFVIISLVRNVSKLALFASVLVLNPPVKWGVYGASFWPGSILLGPIDGVSRSDISLSAAPEIVSRLLVGNLILAVVFTVIGYVVAYGLTGAYRRRNGTVGVLDTMLDRMRDSSKR